TRLLHSLTRHAAVVASPRTQLERLARIDLVALREGRVLAVLVSKGGVVQNRLLGDPPGAAASLAGAGRQSGYPTGALGGRGLAEPAEVSIVAAPYRVAGEIVGTLGVIGPTRMDYSRVIPLVEFTARTIGSALQIVRE